MSQILSTRSILVKRRDKSSVYPSPREASQSCRADVSCVRRSVLLCLPPLFFFFPLYFFLFFIVLHMGCSLPCAHVEPSQISVPVPPPFSTRPLSPSPNICNPPPLSLSLSIYISLFLSPFSLHLSHPHRRVVRRSPSLERRKRKA